MASIMPTDAEIRAAIVKYQVKLTEIASAKRLKHGNGYMKFNFNSPADLKRFLQKFHKGNYTIGVKWIPYMKGDVCDLEGYELPREFIKQFDAEGCCIVVIVVSCGENQAVLPIPMKITNN